MIRTYKKACDFCGASGRVPANGACSSPYETCPVCDGSKTITVTETITETNDITTNNEILLT